MYVSDLDQNNFIWGPQLDNDWQYLKKTRYIIDVLCKSFPMATVVLKLYPSQRYADAYDFSDMVKIFPNLKIVGGIDFRFLRNAANVIFTSSTQSTLGWVSTSQVPNFVLEFAWSPSKVKGLRLQLAETGDLNALVIPDEDGVCQGSHKNIALNLLCD